MMERDPGDLPPVPTDWEERLARRVKAELFDSVRTDFEDSSRLSPPDIEKVLLEKLADLLRNEDALAVLCRKNDTATCYAYPSASGAIARNAFVFCPELRRALVSPRTE